MEREPLAALPAWPPVKTDRNQSSSDQQLFEGIDGDWYSIPDPAPPLLKGVSFSYRAVPVVMDDESRILVGLRRTGRGRERRLALLGDENYVHVGQRLSASAADGLLEARGWPFGAGDVSAVHRIASALLRVPPFPVAFHRDIGSGVAVFCLPFILMRQAAVHRLPAHEGWVGRRVRWCPFMEVIAALEGNLEPIRRSFGCQSVTTGFPSELALPLFDQLSWFLR